MVCFMCTISKKLYIKNIQKKVLGAHECGLETIIHYICQVSEVNGRDLWSRDQPPTKNCSLGLGLDILWSSCPDFGLARESASLQMITMF